MQQAIVATWCFDNTHEHIQKITHLHQFMYDMHAYLHA